MEAEEKEKVLADVIRTIEERSRQDEERKVAEPSSWVSQSKWLACGMFGSHAHGTYIPPTEENGTDDTDIFLIAAQPFAHYVSLFPPPRDCVSTAGSDIDLLVYDIKKFITMLSAQNPNMHAWLWTDKIISTSREWEYLVEIRDKLISKQMFTRLTKYAEGQFKDATQAGTKKRYMGEKRNMVMEKYGFDTRSAAHAVRLYIQAYLLGTTGNLVVSIPGKYGDAVKDIKSGKVSFDQVQEWINTFKPLVDGAIEMSDLPDEIPVGNFEIIWKSIMAGMVFRDSHAD